MDQQIRRLEINPVKFYALCRLLVAAKDKNPLPPEFIEKVNEGAAQMDDWVHKLAQANNALLQEARQTSRRRHNPFDETEEKDPFADLRHSIDDANFLRVVFDTASAFQIAYGRLKAVVEGLGAPGPREPGIKVEWRHWRAMLEPTNTFAPYYGPLFEHLGWV